MSFVQKAGIRRGYSSMKKAPHLTSGARPAHHFSRQFYSEGGVGAGVGSGVATASGVLLLTSEP